MAIGKTQVSDSTTSAISHYKVLVGRMLEERSRETEPTASPSGYWSGYCKHIEYLMGLDERFFARLRDHTWHLTGDNYSRYLHPQVLNTRPTLEQGFRNIWSRLPPHLHLEEPETSFGLEIDGRIVNTDLLRYQRLIAAMHEAHLLGYIKSPQATTLEIGAGYGGFAHQLSSCLGLGPCQYIIVDLPEVLLFSAAYLSIHNGPSSVYLYDANSPPKIGQVVSDVCTQNSRFILIPNYRLDILAGLELSFAINIASFQEMTVDQVNNYLTHLNQHLTGTLLSFNRPNNGEANSQLTDLRQLINSYFDSRLVELPLTEKIPPWAALYRNCRQSIRSIVGRPARYSDYELTLSTPR